MSAERLAALMDKLRKREQQQPARPPGHDPFAGTNLDESPFGGVGLGGGEFSNGFGDYADPFAAPFDSARFGEGAYDAYGFGFDHRGDNGTMDDASLSSFIPPSTSPPSDRADRNRGPGSSPPSFKFEDFYIDDKKGAERERFVPNGAVTVVSDMQGAFPRPSAQGPSLPQNHTTQNQNPQNQTTAARDQLPSSSAPNPPRIPNLHNPGPIPVSTSASASAPNRSTGDDEPLSKFRPGPERNSGLPPSNNTGPSPTTNTLPRGSSSEFGDGDDDSWIQNALAEASKVEASSGPQPPGPTTSPFFANVNKRSTQSAQSTPPLLPRPQAELERPLSGLRPPSRPTSSTANVSFPKLVRRGNSRSPANAAHVTYPAASAAAPVSSALAPHDIINGRSPVQAPKSPPPPLLHEPTFNHDDRVPVMALDTPIERSIFPYTHFNAMQSAIFQAAYNSDQNLVVSAPTGSGKTTVFELAILKMLKNENGHHKPLGIYMAPTKALVNERLRDWQFRLGRINRFKCLEVTGDVDVKAIKEHLSTCDLIVTTPEKWDSITRRGSTDLDRLRLMMIDEVHILQEDRGPTLEVVVSRMKAKGTRIRFVAVSASVPNMEDVARWIGPNEEELSRTGNGVQTRKTAADYDNIEEMPQATVFKFGDEFRPVPLTKHVIGTDAFNEFVLGPKLDKELFPVLNMYSAQKPVLIFCPTRKGCAATADQLCKDYCTALELKRRVPWDWRQNEQLQLNDKKVEEFTKFGIAIHHAGLDALDRRAIEEAFKTGRLHCIVATSTLAVGVNLPAHLVVIKGTSMWQGSGFRDYTDVDIQQMMGRAGRPQYDNSGTVVIMCNSTKKVHYETMLAGTTPLESCLHLHLTEHINSEIGLQTIVDLESGKRWLHGTFLAIRIKQNPRPYVKTLSLSKGHSQSWKEALDHYIEKALKDLGDDNLIQYKDPEDVDSPREANELTPAIYGKIMSQNFISYATMKAILGMPEDASFPQLLQILAGAIEFSSLRIRQGEGGILNKLREHPEIRYHVHEPVKTYADKVFLHLQVTFGNVSLEKISTKSEISSPLQTQLLIFNTAPRVAKTILMVALEKRFAVASRSALELLHTINGKAWEDSASVFRQIPNIGPKSLHVLGTNGMVGFEDIIQMETGRLEMWLNRNAGFGQKVIDWAKLFPRFTLEFEPRDLKSTEDGYPRLSLSIIVNWTGSLKQLDNMLFKNFKTGTTPAHTTHMKGKWHNLTLLFITSTNRFLECRVLEGWRIATDKDKILQNSARFDMTVTLEDPDEKIIGIVGVDERAGLSSTFEYNPSIDRSQFPEKPKEADKIKKAAKTKESMEEDLDLLLGTGTTRQADKITTEPLFLAKDDDDRSDTIYEIDDDEEVIDLTLTPKQRRSGAARRAPSRGEKKKRVKVSAFIDDEAEESDDASMDEDVRSVNSLDEFNQFFDDEPRHSPRKTKHRGKSKPISKRKAVESEEKRSKPVMKATTAQSAPASRSAPTWVTSTPSPVNGTSSHAKDDQPGPSTRKPRHPFFNRSPSVGRATTPFKPVGTLHSTLAPERSALPPTRTNGSKSPSPEFLPFTVDVPMDDADPSPPSGQADDDFDSWMTSMLEQA